MTAASSPIRATEPAALSDASLAAIIASLRPLQALSGGLRALPLDPDRVQSSPSPDRGASDGASDNGVLGRARMLSRRLGQIPMAERVTLEWLVAYSHAGAGPRELGVLLARTAGPIDLRDAVDLAEHHRRATQSAEAVLGREVQHARQRLRVGVAVLTDADVKRRHDVARATVATAEARLTAAQGELATWGYTKIVSACEAWQGAGR